MGKVFQTTINITYVVLLVVCISCNRSILDTDDILQVAGDNWTELEHVLDHYGNNDDTLKLKAAVYLLKNMPGHAWKQSESSQKYEEYIKDSPKRLSADSLNILWRNCTDGYSNEMYQCEDIKCITSEYLIKHIDEMFEAWHSYPWCKNIDFDLFCRYILPYRIYDERIGQCWPHEFRKKYSYLVKDISDIRVAFAKIYNAINDSLRGSSTHCPYNLDPLTILKAKGVSCEKRAIVIGAALRSFGIPVAFDYTKGFANYSKIGMHAWISSQEKSNTPLTVMGCDSIAQHGNPIDAPFFWKMDKQPKDYPIIDNPKKKIVKVYRYDYQLKEDTTHIKDVSSLYNLNGKLLLSLSKDIKKVSLLTYHPGSGWRKEFSVIPHLGRCAFNNIGTEIVYLIQVETNDSVYYHGSPMVLLKDNSIKILNPSSKTQKVNLYRKYPWLTLWYNRWSMMKGSRFEVSNDSMFKKRKIIFSFHTMPWLRNTIRLRSNESFRYVRFMPSLLSKKDVDSLTFYNGVEEVNKSSVSEVRFYSCGKELRGNVILNNINSEMANNAFDGDINTTCMHDTMHYWIGMDFGYPRNIDKIVFYPRHDDNFVRKDDLYELFYWNKAEWNSLGQRIGKEDGESIIFDNVPYNALLLLKNLTRGQEEAVFTYNKGKQIFW